MPRSGSRSMVVFRAVIRSRSMALGGRSCPYCRNYTALEDSRCTRCGSYIPPEPIASLLREPLITEYWATKLLAAISIIVFALEMSNAGPAHTGLLSGMRPSIMLKYGALTSGLERAEPWRALSSCFVHMGVLHIVLNLVALAELGRAAEVEIKGARFILTYVVTGIAGFAFSAWWYHPDPYFTAGASGAVFGIDGLLVAGMAARGDSRWRSALMRTIVHSFMFYMVVTTNQAAHMGGLAAGLALGLVFAKESRPWLRETGVRIAAAVSIVACFASIALSTRSPVWRAQAELEIQQELYGAD